MTLSSHRQHKIYISAIMGYGLGSEDPEELFYYNKIKDEIKNNKAKAAIISIWEDSSKSSLQIDLWTKEMMAEEMKFFVFQILNSLSDTYKKSVGDEKLAKEIKDFAIHMGKKSNVLK